MSQGSLRHHLENLLLSHRPAAPKCTQHYSCAVSSVKWANKSHHPPQSMYQQVLITAPVHKYRSLLGDYGWCGCLGHLVALGPSPFVLEVINNILIFRFVWLRCLVSQMWRMLWAHPIKQSVCQWPQKHFLLKSAVTRAWKLLPRHVFTSCLSQLVDSLLNLPAFLFF